MAAKKNTVKKVKGFRKRCLVVGTRWSFQPWTDDLHQFINHAARIKMLLKDGQANDCHGHVMSPSEAVTTSTGLKRFWLSLIVRPEKHRV